MTKQNIKVSDRVAAMLNTSTGPLSTLKETRLATDFIKSLRFKDGTNQKHQVTLFVRALDILKKNHPREFSRAEVLYFTRFQEIEAADALRLFGLWTSFMENNGLIKEIPSIEGGLYSWQKI
jgi:hypothetical protein